MSEKGTPMQGEKPPTKPHRDYVDPTPGEKPPAIPRSGAAEQIPTSDGAADDHEPTKREG